MTELSLSQVPFNEIISQIVTKFPCPAGGAVSAMGGVLASSLIMKAFNLNFKKSQDSESREKFEEVKLICAELLTLIDKDTTLFNQFYQHYRELGDINDAKVQKLLLDSTLIPLEIADSCIKMIDHLIYVKAKSSKMMLADLKIASLFVKTTAKSAISISNSNMELIQSGNSKDHIMKKIVKFQNIIQNFTP